LKFESPPPPLLKKKKDKIKIYKNQIIVFRFKKKKKGIDFSCVKMLIHVVSIYKIDKIKSYFAKLGINLMLGQDFR
jgi:hypothetical protein